MPQIVTHKVSTPGQRQHWRVASGRWLPGMYASESAARMAALWPLPFLQDLERRINGHRGELISERHFTVG